MGLVKGAVVEIREPIGGRERIETGNGPPAFGTWPVVIPERCDGDEQRIDPPQAKGRRLCQVCLG